MHTADRWIRAVPPPRRRSIAGLLGLGALLAAATVLFPFRAGIICGNSMYPTLRSGQLYILERRHPGSAAPRRGDVVVFRHQGELYVKRVAAAEGDSVYLLRLANAPDDNLVMDWQLSSLRKLVAREPWRGRMRLIHRRVPPGHYYVLGDELASSIDSRSFGLIPVEAIVGTVLHAPPPPEPLQHVAGNYRRRSRS